MLRSLILCLGFLFADIQASTGCKHCSKTDHQPGNRSLLYKGNGIIHGVFYFYIGTDPTYGVIEDGNWRSDTPYGTIHRIAGDGSGGVLAAAVAFGKTKINHIRIDTHHDNKIMQRAIAKQGFCRSGIIYLEDGSPRIAYDLLTE